MHKFPQEQPCQTILRIFSICFTRIFLTNSKCRSWIFKNTIFYIKMLDRFKNHHWFQFLEMIFKIISFASSSFIFFKSTSLYIFSCDFLSVLSRLFRNLLSIILVFLLVFLLLPNLVFSSFRWVRKYLRGKFSCSGVSVLQTQNTDPHLFLLNRHF